MYHATQSADPLRAIEANIGQCASCRTAWKWRFAVRLDQTRCPRGCGEAPLALPLEDWRELDLYACGSLDVLRPELLPAHT